MTIFGLGVCFYALSLLGRPSLCPRPTEPPPAPGATRSSSNADARRDVSPGDRDRDACRTPRLRTYLAGRRSDTTRRSRKLELRLGPPISASRGVPWFRPRHCPRNRCPRRMLAVPVAPYLCARFGVTVAIGGRDGFSRRPDGPVPSGIRVQRGLRSGRTRPAPPSISRRRRGDLNHPGSCQSTEAPRMSTSTPGKGRHGTLLLQRDHHRRHR